MTDTTPSITGHRTHREPAFLVKHYALLVSLLLVLALSSVTQWFLVRFWGYKDPGSAADATAAVVAALAFGGVIISIKLQIDELTATRDELRGQKEQLQAQVRSLERQQRTATFFELLRIQRAAATATELSLKSGVRGENAFVAIGYDVTLALDSVSRAAERGAETDPTEVALCLKKVFDPLQDPRAGNFSVYIDTTLELLAFANQATDHRERSFYRTLTATQLSAAQKEALIFWAAYCGARLPDASARDLEVFLASASSTALGNMAYIAFSTAIRRIRKDRADCNSTT